MSPWFFFGSLVGDAAAVIWIFWYTRRSRRQITAELEAINAEGSAAMKRLSVEMLADLAQRTDIMIAQGRRIERRAFYLAGAALDPLGRLVVLPTDHTGPPN